MRYGKIHVILDRNFALLILLVVRQVFVCLIGLEIVSHCWKPANITGEKKKTEYNLKNGGNGGKVWELFSLSCLSEGQFWNQQPQLCSYIALFDFPDRQVESTLYTILCLQSIAFIVKLDCQKVWNVQPCQVCVSHLPACSMRKSQGSKKENQPGWQNILC